MSRKLLTMLLVLPALTATIAGVGGCRGERTDKPPRQIFPDMDDQPRFRPQNETTFFADGRTQRQPVSGTVAYARWNGDVTGDAFLESDWSKPILEERARLIKSDRELYFGSVGDDPAQASFWTETIPVAVDRDVIMHGQQKFNIYCAACHGYDGNGLGMVGQRWSYPVPNFHDDKYQREAGQTEKTGRDGYLYHVARNGIPNELQPGYYKMPPYSHALDEDDAWAVVAYIRTLQRAKRGTLDDVTEEERRRLNELRGLPTVSAGRATDAVATAGEGDTQ